MHVLVTPALECLLAPLHGAGKRFFSGVYPQMHLVRAGVATMSAALLAHKAVAGNPLPITECLVNKPFWFGLLELTRVDLLLFVLLVLPLLKKGILQVKSTKCR